MSNIRKNNPRVIQSIQRALDIIDCFDQQKKEISLHEISQRLNLNKSTTHGIINTLHINGYIDQHPESGKYMLGKKLKIKGMLVADMTAVNLKESGSKYMKIIAEKFKITCHIFSIRNNSLSIVEMIIPSNSYYIVSSVVGREMPLHATASGKIVLTNMKEKERKDYFQREIHKMTDKTAVNLEEIQDEIDHIEQFQYSVEDEEVETGVYSLAVPIYDSAKQLIGTISVTGPVSKVKDHSQSIIEDLTNASRKITEEISII